MRRASSFSPAYGRGDGGQTVLTTLQFFRQFVAPPRTQRGVFFGAIAQISGDDAFFEQVLGAVEGGREVVARRQVRLQRGNQINAGASQVEVGLVQARVENGEELPLFDEVAAVDEDIFEHSRQNAAADFDDLGWLDDAVENDLPVAGRGR